MRKVLLRIVFDQLWKLESVGNELLVGYGWAISFWAVVATVSLFVLWKMSKDIGQVFSSLIFWSLIPTAIALVPVLNLPVEESGIPVFGYGFMLFIAFSTATVLAARRARSIDMDPDVIWNLMMWLLVPGLIGARIIYLMQNHQRVFAQARGLGDFLWAAISLWDGGIVFYGCIIGGGVGLVLYCRRINIRPLQLADVLMPSLFVGLGFGRIGCFLYGCCFGAACSLPWAVHFPADSMTFNVLAGRWLATGNPVIEQDGKPIGGELIRPAVDYLETHTNASAMEALSSIAPDSVFTTIALHPTQIYSSLLAFSLAFLLAWYFRRRPFEGAVLALACIIYPINRFVLEIIRDDEPGRLGTFFTFSQLTSMALFAAGCGLMFRLHRKHLATK
ncbi:MAG: prolipoprotein diacylglyceryl transferase [Planctomycetaceae bacterium]